MKEEVIRIKSKEKKDTKNKQSFVLEKGKSLWLFFV
jgi:hypothetical protein